MADGRTLTGLDTSDDRPTQDPDGIDQGRGQLVDRGLLGTNDDAEELGAAPTCKDVNRVWDVNKRRSTPAIQVSGATLAAVKASLDASQGDHWGEGGGEMTIDNLVGIKAGEQFTVTLRGEFINRIPEWTDQSSASNPAQAEWERFIAKLKAHEECHVTIARKAFEALADKYPGKKITEVNTMFLQAKAALKQAQKDLDSASVTDHGKKSGVACGDALLNASIA